MCQFTEHTHFIMEQVYDEWCVLRTAMTEGGVLFGSSADHIEKWCTFFRRCSADGIFKCANLLTLVQFVLSLNCTNAFCERVFSAMKLLWRDERGNLDVETVRAELFLCFNIEDTCEQFHTAVKSNSALLCAASSSSKYKPRLHK